MKRRENSRKRSLLLSFKKKKKKSHLFAFSKEEKALIHQKSRKRYKSIMSSSVATAYTLGVRTRAQKGGWAREICGI
jgi:hypothetical protein